MSELTTTKEEQSKSQKNTSNETLTLLIVIEQIVELSEGSKLSDDFFKDAKRYISYVSKKLSLNPIQTVFFSVFVDECFGMK